jgi:hypothetical protein|tara:strand:- start:1274 stop:1720 length:447 start_codon:yes stop_codon:yes gene_type:complete
MSIDRDVAVKNVRKSVRIGKKNQRELIRRYLAFLKKGTGHTHRAVVMPDKSSFDYIIVHKNKALYQLEVKIRSKYYEETIIPTQKEMVALFDLSHHHLKTYLLAYYIDIDKTYLYDITTPPADRKDMTRKDRNISNLHSFYGTKTQII